MGQYYKVIVKRGDTTKTYEPQTTLWKKELERAKRNHSYQPNYDYMNGQKLLEHSWKGCDIIESLNVMLYKNPAQVAWVGDYADDFEWADRTTPDPKELHKVAWEGEESEYFEIQTPDTPATYLLNHDKKEYIDIADFEKQSSDGSWTLAVVPLMTACGNGLGGGDYSGDNEDMVGLWCMDTISLDDTIPSDYKKLDIYFKEK